MTSREALSQQKGAPRVGVGAAAIWYVDAPDPMSILRSAPSGDTDAAAALARRMFPGLEPDLVGHAPITAFSVATKPNRVLVGCYPGVTVVCSAEPAVVEPSTLQDNWVRPLASERTYLFAAETAHAWGAFAEWDRGVLRRSFSASPAYIHENEGLPGSWERPFWAGDHPMQYPGGVMPDPQSLPFHPQEFADTACSRWLGLRMIGPAQEGEIDSSSILLCDFAMRDPSAPTPAPPASEPVEETPAPKKKRRLFRRAVG